ncbi:hypothetical protein [Streptomyces anulatus]|uniref:hypothetical protein n=1 Tax=Streptomyces anulatus TaxID=1892 RepID=UPI00365A8189
MDDKRRPLVFSIALDRRTERAHYDASWAHTTGLPNELNMRRDGDLGSPASTPDNRFCSAR